MVRPCIFTDEIERLITHQRCNFGRVASTLACVDPELWMEILNTNGFTDAVAQDDLEQVSFALCLSSAKLRSTDSVNPRAVLSRVRPRYRHLL